MSKHNFAIELPSPAVGLAENNTDKTLKSTYFNFIDCQKHASSVHLLDENSSSFWSSMKWDEKWTPEIEMWEYSLCPSKN